MSKDVVDELSKKAKQATTALDAMHYSQAAVNVANAMIALKAAQKQGN